MSSTMWDDASNPVSNKVFYDKPQAPPSYAALLSGLVKEFVAWHDGESSIATFAKNWCEALLDLRNEKPELAYDFDGLLAAFSAKQQKKHQKSNKKKPGAEKEENDDFAPTANVRPMLTKFSLEVVRFRPRDVVKFADDYFGALVDGDLADFLVHEAEKLEKEQLKKKEGN